MKFAGQLWANGRFGVSRLKEIRLFCDSHRENQWIHPFVRVAIATHGIITTLDWMRGARERGEFPSLDLPNVSNSHKTPRPRGSKGLGSFGRNMIENGAGLLERKAGKSCLSFVTLTVPTCSLAEYVQFAPHWANCIREIQQWLSRRLLARKLSAEVIGVSEIQIKRYRDSGIPALHYHGVFQGKLKKKSSWAISPDKLRRAWKRIIQQYFPSAESWHSSASINIVRKSAAGYLGKYMSKGYKDCERLMSEGLTECIPASWWNMSIALRRAVKKERRKGCDVGDLMNFLIENPGLVEFTYLSPVKLMHPAIGEYIVGWSGIVAKKDVEKIREIIDKGR